MRTLWNSSSSRICSNDVRGREIKFDSLRQILFRNKIIFLSSPKQIGISFSNSIGLQQHRKRNQLVYVSSATQEALPDEQTQIQDTSKKVHVKFQLQRKCSFGEHFLLLGDDNMFGSWDPLSAIPLDWSDGDIWTVEMDIPIGKAINYKFLLKKITGDISWQPGPDRVLKTWETKKTIAVFEHWENSELQMISEEEFVPKNEKELIVGSDKTIITENITGVENTGSEKEPARKKNNKATSEKSSIRTSEEQKPDHVLNNEGSYEGAPVLVPGLSPIDAIDTQDKSLSESSNHIADSNPSQAEKLEEQNGPEEKEYDNKQEITYDPRDMKGQTSMKQIETVFKNDIQWSRLTLQKVLNSFGF